jgi:hypothetical protein
MTSITHQDLITLTFSMSDRRIRYKTYLSDVFEKAAFDRITQVGRRFSSSDHNKQRIDLTHFEMALHLMSDHQDIFYTRTSH